MSDKVNLKIITPTGIIYDDTVDMVIMRTQCGDVGILPGHQPMVTILDYGALKIISDGQEINRAAVLGGYAEVGSEGVSILTDAAEWEQDIDTERAKKALDRAEKRLSGKESEIDVLRAELSLKRAMVRLNLKDL